MGLGLSHIQLTEQRSKKLRFLYCDEWEECCNVPLDIYSKYITTIEDNFYNKKIAIVRDETQLEMLNKSDMFFDMDYLKIFIAEQNADLKDEIRKFVNIKKLDQLKTTQETHHIEGLNFETIYYGEIHKVDVVHFIDDIGHQRNGMNDLFHEVFDKKLLWGKKEDFELAYTCIGGEWYIEHWGEKAIEKMKKNFKKNFLDKFEFGKSLLCVA